MKTTAKKKKNSFRLLDIVLVIAAIGLMLGLVISSVQLNDITREIRICKEDIEELKSD